MNRLKLLQTSFLLILITSFLSSCEAITGIFKAGVWVGIIVVVGVIALILYLVGKSRKLISGRISTFIKSYLFQAPGNRAFPVCSITAH